MKNSKLKFSEYMQNISRSKIFGKFVLIVYISSFTPQMFCFNYTFESKQLRSYLVKLVKRKHDCRKIRLYSAYMLAMQYRSGCNSSDK